jgi:hypothetical protein
MGNTKVDPRLFQPQHKVWKPNVEVPTIFFEPLDDGRPPEVSVQWFGVADLEFLTREFGNEVEEAFSRMQFRFPLSVDANDPHWMGHPELFKVVFIGPIKDWPKRGALAEVGGPEELVFYTVSTHFTVQYASGLGPGSFLFKLDVMLGDGLYGVIRPKFYSDFNVLARANREIEHKVDDVCNIL